MQWKQSVMQAHALVSWHLMALSWQLRNATQTNCSMISHTPTKSTDCMSELPVPAYSVERYSAYPATGYIAITSSIDHNQCWRKSKFF